MAHFLILPITAAHRDFALPLSIAFTEGIARGWA